MNTTLEQDLGFEPITENETAQPEPQVQQVEQPQQEVTPQENEVLSLNDETGSTAETPADTQDLTPTLVADRDSILNELFGTTDSESIKSRLAEVDRLKAEVEKPRYQSKFAEIADNLVSKYGDPKSQADVFKRTIDVLTTDVDSLDDKAALQFQMKQEYPSLSDEEIGLLIGEKYSLNDYNTEEQQRLGAIKMKLDSQKAKLEIKTLQADAFRDAPSKQSALKQIDEEKRQMEWKPRVQDIAKSINSFEFEVEKGKKMKFDIPEAEKAKLASLAESVAIGSGWLPGAENEKQVQEIVKMTYLYQNAQKLISNAYKKGLSQANSEWSKQVHNPSGLKNTSGSVEIGAGRKGAGEYDENDIVSWLSGGR